MAVRVDDPEGSRESVAHALQNPGSAEPALLTAFALANLPVVDHEGHVVAVPGAPARGAPVPGWVVQALADTYRGGAGVSVADLFGALATTTPLAGVDLAATVLEDLVTATQDDDPDVHGTASLLLEIGALSGGPGSSDALADIHDPADLQLNPVQVQLLLRRLAQEITTAGPSPSSFRSGAAARTGTPSPPCSPSPDQEVAVQSGEKLGREVFRRSLEKLRDAGKIGPGSTVEAKQSAGNVIVAAANYALLVAALHADAELADAPLPRTTSASSDGEQRELRVHVVYRPGRESIVNCWGRFLSLMGLSGLRTPRAGDVANVKVFFRGRQGFDQRERGALVQFHGPIEAVTDPGGRATAVVEGRRQRRELPKDAPRTIRTASVSVQVRPVEVSFYRDMADALSALSVGKDWVPGVDPTSIVNIIKRMNPVPVALFEFPVSDPIAGRRFSIDATWDQARLPSNMLGESDWQEYGSATFHGEIGCLPPAPGDPAGWVCAGDVVAQGKGQFVRYKALGGDELCSSPWWADGNVRYQVIGYSGTADLGTVRLYVDKVIGSAGKTCPGPGADVNPPPPLDATSDRPLPDPGQGWVSEGQATGESHTLRIIAIDD